MPKDKGSNKRRGSTVKKLVLLPLKELTLITVKSYAVQVIVRELLPIQTLLDQVRQRLPWYMNNLGKHLASGATCQCCVKLVTIHTDVALDASLQATGLGPAPI